MDNSAVIAPKYAGFMARLFAFVFDLIVMAGMWLLLSEFVGESASGLLYHMLIVFVTAMYLFVPTLIYGQTPGKMIVGIKVVLTSGSKMTWDDVLLREIVGKAAASALFLFIGYVLVATEPRKQGLHDKFVQSFVIWEHDSNRSNGGESIE